MEQVRIGIVGLGKMGRTHAKYLNNGEIPGAVLSAVSDLWEPARDWAEQNLGHGVKRYSNQDEMFDSGDIDAVLIATPHYEHTQTAIRAFASGLHVLCEKPAGVYTRQVREMNEAARTSGKVFSMMYNQRTKPLYQKVRELVQSGELGKIIRTNWIITDWFRTQSYYNSGGWRATWAGEGGGVLLNQDPHQIDLWQWTVDMMPVRVRAFCGFGKFHDIEVEDDVTAYVEYANGATGVFVTSTGESPGTNRYEISGELGKAVIENGQLQFWRNRVSTSEQISNGLGKPESWQCDIPLKEAAMGHRGITENFVEAILHNKPLLAPGEEGIKALEISNAMLLSSWTDKWVDLPIDEELYYQKLQEKIAESQHKA